MEEDFNQIPEEYKPKRFNHIVVAFIILVILALFWAFLTGRLP